MGSPYIGEIRMGGWSFAPLGWAFCNGQAIAIDQNSTLYNLIGTTYGGDGQTSYLLPDLQGRIPYHQGTNTGSGSTYALGQKAGTESVTLTLNQIPNHSHTVLGTSATSSLPSPVNNSLATQATKFVYHNIGKPRAMAAAVVNVGGSIPHDNIQPYQCVTFVISLSGIYPSQG